ncbi:MAG: heme exporter protein CcmB [Rhizobiales bacterium PAR1]|nr:MAG: heme exporter protein CcmB [Rhizobiales bacterium PAR1]
MNALFAVIRREITLARRIGAGAELGIVFFLILISVVPFAIGADQKLIGRIAPAILWLAALLATLLGLDRLLQADEEDGIVDHLLLGDTPLMLVLAAKALAHWLVTGLPLSLVAPLLGLMLAIEPGAMLPLTISLLIGTPALTLIGLVGASLTVSLKRGGLLLSVLVLPLSIPTLIFGATVVKEAAAGRAYETPLMLLAGVSLIMLVIAPLAAAGALRFARN